MSPERFKAVAEIVQIDDFECSWKRDISLSKNFIQKTFG